MIYRYYMNQRSDADPNVLHSEAGSLADAPQHHGMCAEVRQGEIQSESSVLLDSCT